MNLWNVLIKGYYENGFINHFVVPVHANSQEEAELISDSLLQKDFTAITEYETIAIQREPFHLKKWTVKISVIFSDMKQKFMFIRIGSLNERIAKETALELVLSKDGVKTAEAVECVMYDPRI